jgi:hypothetical protein
VTALGNREPSKARGAGLWKISDAKKTMKADIDRLLGALEPVKEGDQMVFTYVPGTGTTRAINGKETLTIAGPAFGQVLFSVWLGPKPPNAGLKKGILGE